MNSWQSLRKLISIFRHRVVVDVRDLPFGEVYKGFRLVEYNWTIVLGFLDQGTGKNRSKT
jgi:hypothetical protein